VTAFLVFAGLLVAGALLLILPPLLGYGRRSQAQMRQSAMVLTVLREQLADLDAELAEGRIDAATHAKSREELERRALEEAEVAAETADSADRRPSKAWALATGLAIPALAVGTYLMIGEPAALDPKNVEGQQGFTQEQVTEMVGSLEKHLAANPDNAEGWAMLARTYLVLKDFPKAAAAYERLDKLVPNDPDVLSDWADVVAAQTGKVGSDAEALVLRALEAEPKHPKALALAGTAAYQRDDFAAAAAVVRAPSGRRYVLAIEAERARTPADQRALYWRAVDALISAGCTSIVGGYETNSGAGLFLPEADWYADAAARRARGYLSPIPEPEATTGAGKYSSDRLDRVTDHIADGRLRFARELIQSPSWSRLSRIPHDHDDDADAIERADHLLVEDFDRDAFYRGL